MQLRNEYKETCVEYQGEVLTIPVVGMRYQRPVVKTEKCCHCGTCYLFCPTGCIIDKGSYFVANLDYCKGCGTCAKECPVDAITLVREEMYAYGS